MQKMTKNIFFNPYISEFCFKLIVFTQFFAENSIYENNFFYNKTKSKFYFGKT